MFKKVYLGTLFLLFIGFIYLAFITFQPIRNVTESNVSLVKGVVNAVNEENGNVFIQLQGDEHLYYVKSYRKHRLDFLEIEQAILKKEITLHHINKWTPFTRDRIHPHISRIEVDGNIVFNEIEQ